MGKKIFVFISFLLFLYIAHSILVNPSGRNTFLFLGLFIIIFYIYISYKAPIVALSIFLIYLPFYFYIRTKVFNNSMVGIASKDILLGLLFFVWMFKKIDQRQSISLPGWWKVAIFYFIIASINLVKAPSFMAGILDWRIMVFYPLTAIMFFDIINTREKFLKLLRLLIYIGIVVALIGLYQRIVFMKYGRSYAEQLFGIESIRVMYTEVFITSTVGHHGVLGLYLVILLGYLFIIHSEKSKMIPIWLKLIVVGLFTLDIVFTSNRTAWVGFMIFALFVFLTLKKNKFLYTIIMLSIFLGLVLGNQFVSKRFSDILHPMENGSTFRLRYLGWKDKLKIALERPFGVGLGKVGMTARSSEGVAESMIKLRGYSRVVDNFYFVIFIEMGYPGFIFFLFFWGALFFERLKQYRLNKNSINIIAFALIVIFSFADFTGAYFNFILLQMYLWVALAGVYIGDGVSNLSKITKSKG